MEKQIVNINPIDLKTVECEKCNGILFTPVTLYKIVPRFYTKTGSDEETPISLRRCVACGHVPGIEVLVKNVTVINKLAEPSPERITLSAKSDPLI